MKKNNIMANAVDESPPKKLSKYGSNRKLGMINSGMLVMDVETNVIIRFVNSNPNPYSSKIINLFFTVFDIPDDQKKKMALSSQGIAV